MTLRDYTGSWALGSWWSSQDVGGESSCGFPQLVCRQQVKSLLVSTVYPLPLSTLTANLGMHLGHVRLVLGARQALAGPAPRYHSCLADIPSEIFSTGLLGIWALGAVDSDAWLQDLNFRPNFVLRLRHLSKFSVQPGNPSLTVIDTFAAVSPSLPRMSTQ